MRSSENWRRRRNHGGSLYNDFLIRPRAIIFVVALREIKFHAVNITGEHAGQTADANPIGRLGVEWSQPGIAFDRSQRNESRWRRDRRIGYIVNLPIPAVIPPGDIGRSEEHT